MLNCSNCISGRMKKNTSSSSTGSNAAIASAGFRRAAPMRDGAVATRLFLGMRLISPLQHDDSVFRQRDANPIARREGVTVERRQRESVQPLIPDRDPVGDIAALKDR